MTHQPKILTCQIENKKFLLTTDHTNRFLARSCNVSGPHKYPFSPRFSIAEGELEINLVSRFERHCDDERVKLIEASKNVKKRVTEYIRVWRPKVALCHSREKNIQQMKITVVVHFLL